jgi:hypothetical protein
LVDTNEIPVAADPRVALHPQRAGVHDADAVVTPDEDLFEGQMAPVHHPGRSVKGLLRATPPEGSATARDGDVRDGHGGALLHRHGDAATVTIEERLGSGRPDAFDDEALVDDRRAITGAAQREPVASFRGIDGGLSDL